MLPLVDVLGVVLMSVLVVPDVEPVPDIEPDAPIEVPLPVVPDAVVSVEGVPVVPEPIEEAVELLVVSLVDGVVGSVLAVDDEGVVDVSVAVSDLRSPQAARDMAATRARARGVAFIRTLL